MPRFFFHVRDHGQGLSRDLLGLDFPEDTHMRRREVLAISVAIGLWPLTAARAQPFRPYQLAVVHPSFPASAMSRVGEADFRAYFDELLRLGYEEGRNLLIHRLSGNGQADQY